MSTTIPSTTALRLQAQVAFALPAGLPHFFDTWVRARVTTTLQTRAGLAAKAGDVVLAQPGTRGAARSFYSWRTGRITEVPAGALVDVPAGPADDAPCCEAGAEH